MLRISTRILLSVVALMLCIGAASVVVSAETNLITNGGFETTAGWQFFATGAARTTDVKRSGNYALKLTAEDSSNPYAAFRVSQSVYPYATYRISGYIHFENAPASGGAAIKYEYRRKDGETLTSAAADRLSPYFQPDGNTWVAFSEEFVMPENCNYIALYFRMYDAGTIYYDDVSFVMTSPPPVTVLETNAVYYYTEQERGTATLNINTACYNAAVYNGCTAAFSISDDNDTIVWSHNKTMQNGIATDTFMLEDALPDKGKQYILHCVLRRGSTIIEEKSTDIYRYDRPKNIDANGNYTVKGQRFNPVLAYHVSASQYPLCREIGVNVVQVFLPRSSPPRDIVAVLDTLNAHGLKALVALYYGGKAAGNDANRASTEKIVSAVKDHDAVFAYAVQDEPSATSEPDLKKSYKLIRDIDDTHPVYIVECLNKLFPMVEKYADIVACDPYPAFSGAGVDPISTFPARDTALAVVAAGGKPVLPVLQLMPYRGYTPTYAEMRHGVYQVMLQGASYMGFYPMYEGDWFLLQETDLWDDMHRLAAVDLPRFFQYRQDGEQLTTTTNQYGKWVKCRIGDAQYIIAMSSSDTLPATLRIPLAGQRPAADYYTSLTGCTIENDTLHITLAPRELKIFRCTDSPLYCSQDGVPIDTLRTGTLQFSYDTPTNGDTLYIATYKVVNGQKTLSSLSATSFNATGNCHAEITATADISTAKAFVWNACRSQTTALTLHYT